MSEQSIVIDKKSELISQVEALKIPYGGIKIIETLPIKFSQLELTPFTGTMWSESWGWKKSNLEKLSENDLQELIDFISALND